jgi:hypothetical protein
LVSLFTLPPKFGKFVSKLLEKKPDDRYQSAVSAIAALDEVHAELLAVSRAGGVDDAKPFSLRAFAVHTWQAAEPKLRTLSSAAANFARRHPRVSILTAVGFGLFCALMLALCDARDNPPILVGAVLPSATTTPSALSSDSQAASASASTSAKPDSPPATPAHGGRRRRH